MKTEYNSKLIYVIAVVAATGGLLFGFDTGVISGAIPFFQKDFGIDNGMIEIITASGLCGAILGALFCGKVTDTLGRMHSDAQFAGSSSVPAHVEMMGFLGIGNNPMVGCTVACAVNVALALNK